MREKIEAIINKVGIKDVGFCAYNKVLENLIECRAKERLPKNAKTVIVCLFPYKVKETPPEKISRYAAVPDYHRVCGEYLKKATEELKKQIDGYQFEWFIDNSPLPEVYTAACAGMGVIGENGLIITEKYGSFVFLGEILCDLPLKSADLTALSNGRTEDIIRRNMKKFEKGDVHDKDLPHPPRRGQTQSARSRRLSLRSPF